MDGRRPQGSAPAPQAAWRRAGLPSKAPHAALAWNPEFLREGFAVEDTLRPDRLVYGVRPGDEGASAVAQLDEVYATAIESGIPRLVMDFATAELVKVSANAFLATKISFINELSILCDQVDGDIQGVARAMGLDRRIGPKFLHAGPGYGGSCFPKDTRAAAHFVKDLGGSFEIVEAVMRVNQRQIEYSLEKISLACNGDLEDKKVAMLGLSFKPETDDVREGPALELIRRLLQGGAHVRAYDPRAMEQASREIPELVCCTDAYDACAGADVLVIVTEWNEFRALDLERVKKMLIHPRLVDLRNIYDPESARGKGLEYWGIGRR